jgi:hypothetical protein
MTVETLTFTAAELDALLAKRRLHDIEEANRRANASWTLMCEKMVAAEREACAAVCEEQSTRWALPMESASYKDMWEQCAAAIRARSKP